MVSNRPFRLLLLLVLPALSLAAPRGSVDQSQLRVLSTLTDASSSTVTKKDRILKTGSCTRIDQDPFAGGSYKECCGDLTICRKDWIGDGRFFNLCVECCEEPCTNSDDAVHVHRHHPGHTHFMCGEDVFPEAPPFFGGKAGKGKGKAGKGYFDWRGKGNYKMGMGKGKMNRRREQEIHSEESYTFRELQEDPLPCPACSTEAMSPWLPSGEYVGCCAGLVDCVEVFGGGQAGARCEVSCPEPVVPEEITDSPTLTPTKQPTPAPTFSPTPLPTAPPTPVPTTSPTVSPAPTTPNHTPAPTVSPTLAPTPVPTPNPTAAPTPVPTPQPTPLPTLSPVTAMPTTNTVDNAVCTVGGLDPWRTGVNQPCCTEFETCLDNWNHDENYFFLCLDSCTLECTVAGQDPWQTSVELPCCAGSEACLGPWNDDATWSYLCLDVCPGREEFPEIPDVDPSVPPAGKRGLAFRAIDEEILQYMSNAVSWAYTWEMTPLTVDISVWEQYGVEFVPQVWGLNSPSEIQTNAVTLFGYNEPNHVSQSNIEPAVAAEFWPFVEAEAAENGITTLVAPSLNFSPDFWQPVAWLDEFLNQCRIQHGRECRIDAIAMHSYACSLDALKDHLAIFDKYNLPIWLTEFACINDVNRLSAEGQAAYLIEVLPWLESTDEITRYAWFSYNFTFREDGAVAEASLTNPDGSLTRLGEIYSNFVRDEAALDALEQVSGAAATSMKWLAATAALLLPFLW